jgi:hypothetical protein
MDSAFKLVCNIQGGAGSDVKVGLSVCPSVRPSVGAGASPLVPQSVCQSVCRYTGCLLAWCLLGVGSG